MAQASKHVICSVDRIVPTSTVRHSARLTKIPLGLRRCHRGDGRSAPIPAAAPAFTPRTRIISRPTSPPVATPAAFDAYLASHVRGAGEDGLSRADRRHCAGPASLPEARHEPGLRPHQAPAPVGPGCRRRSRCASPRASCARATSCRPSASWPRPSASAAARCARRCAASNAAGWSRCRRGRARRRLHRRGRSQPDRRQLPQSLSAGQRVARRTDRGAACGSPRTVRAHRLRARATDGDLDALTANVRRGRGADRGRALRREDRRPDRVPQSPGRAPRATP